MAKTVVGLMENPSEAESVVRELQSACGCERSDIGLMARGSNEVSGAGGTARSAGGQSDTVKAAETGAITGGIIGLVVGGLSLTIPGVGPLIAAGPIASALAGLGIGAVAGAVIDALAEMGVPEAEAHYYAEGVRRGGTLVTVHAQSDATASCAADLMRRHGAVDIDQRAAEWKQQGWQGRIGEPQAQEQVLPVAREELTVGKRAVDEGSVRVYSRVVEKPVEERVTLREEHANVERRPVDRELQAGDEPFQEKSIEVSETGEEPVVGKRTRVTEEVRVGKQAEQREQTVQDKVRQTEVKVDRSRGSGSRAPQSAYQGPERRRRNIAFRGADRRVAYR